MTLDLKRWLSTQGQHRRVKGDRGAPTVRKGKIALAPVRDKNPRPGTGNDIAEEAAAYLTRNALQGAARFAQ